MRRGGALATAALVLGLVVAGARSAQCAALFRLNQRYGSIGFTVSNLGLFRARGIFRQFMGKLTIDRVDPTATHIVVTVRAASVHTPWTEETAMLRSADFFDVTRFKEIRFESQIVTPAGPGRYLIRGALTLRGHTQPIMLHARLVKAARDKQGRPIDDFIVTGTLSRRAFGITADPLFIADTVHLSIRARVILPDGPGG